MEKDEVELRRNRESSVAVACDAFFSWLSAHHDAQSIMQGYEWSFYQSQFLDSVRGVTNQIRANALRQEGGA